ncbi:MAG: galactokinase [Planctomycetota bacterium]|jgi:galactokinase
MPETAPQSDPSGVETFLVDARARVGRPVPLRVFFAPGRVNLMGAHLDYNGGPVMPTAIDRGTWIAVAPRTDRQVVLSSTVEAGRIELDLDALPETPARAWYDYPVGVLRALLDRAAELGGVDLVFGGNLPIGAGLSSSASICVGTAHALGALFELGVGPNDVVSLALEAERGFVGVRCGIMDPFAVAHSQPGRLLWLDCKDESIEHVPLDVETVTIAVADTGVRRELAQGAFNERVEQCRRAFLALRNDVEGAVCLRDVPIEVLDAEQSHMAPVVARRARHVITEVQRAFSARAALEAGDVAGFGRRMTESQTSLRELYEVSIAELDVLVDAAVGVDGVHGSRLTGAGFGGCTVILLQRGAEDELEAALADAYRARFGRRPTVAFYRGDPGPRELEV